MNHGIFYSCQDLSIEMKIKNLKCFFYASKKVHKQMKCHMVSETIFEVDNKKCSSILLIGSVDKNWNWKKGRRSCIINISRDMYDKRHPEK